MSYVDKDAITVEARRAWDGDPKIRAEFNNSFDWYKSFCFANAKGLVDIIGEPKVSTTARIDRVDRRDANASAYLERTWNADPNLRAEFNNDLALYAAYAKGPPR